jgi:hypothetical protein
VDGNAGQAGFVSRAADSERRTWSTSNVSRLLSKLKIHEPSLFPLARSAKFIHTEFCSSHKKTFSCDCPVTLEISGKPYGG